jgi:hypothetical protein
LKRQYQDYLQGMGWKQQLEIRLDGKLLKRFPVGGEAKGRPAAASYAGDGEVDFAGDPEWETYMQLTGDAGLEVRVPVQAGPRTVGVSFVREVFEPEGLPQEVQLGRVVSTTKLHERQRGPVHRRTLRSKGAKDTPSRRAISPRPHLSLARARLRPRFFRGLPGSRIESGDQGRSGHARVFSSREAEFRRGIQFAIERMLWIPTSCCASTGPRLRATPAAQRSR